MGLKCVGKNTLGDPTGTCTNGAIYHNSTDQQTKTCINSLWVAVGAPYVTTLPTNVADGDEVYYVADAANGIVWHLRYNASETTYHWEYLGGPPLTARAGITDTTASSWQKITGVVVPKAGDYTATGAGYANYNSGSGTTYFIHGIGVGSPLNGLYQNITSTFIYTNVADTEKLTGLSASNEIDYYADIQGGLSSLSISTSLQVIPVRIN